MQDKTVDIEKKYESVRYWMPFDIPALLDSEDNAKTLAREFYGWRDQVESDSVDEEGNPTKIMIDNPVTPYEAIAEAFRLQLKNAQETLVIRQAQAMAVEQAKQNFNAIFGN